MSTNIKKSLKSHYFKKKKKVKKYIYVCMKCLFCGIGFNSIDAMSGEESVCS